MMLFTRFGSVLFTALAALATSYAGTAQACQPPALGAPCAQGGPALMPPNEPALNLGAGNPVHLAAGNKYQHELDLPAGAHAPGLEIARHYNALDRRRSVLGQGWALSYDARLHRVGTTWQIVQPDGSRILFASAGAQPRPNRHGRLYAQGQDWVWAWPGGRQMRFNHSGRLIQIRLAPNQVLDVVRHKSAGPLHGAIASVTHSGGAALSMLYRIHGTRAYLRAIDSPAGRFNYNYEPIPTDGGADVNRGAGRNGAEGVRDRIHADGDHDKQPTALRLAGVTRPDGMRRLYLHEPRYQSGNPQHLTGIVIVSVDGKRRSRINTWAYDATGRAILAIQGPPSASTGKVTIQYPTPTGPHSNGLTIVTDAHGNHSRFVTAVRGGRYVLLDASGAGCPGCPAPGSHAQYDPDGRLTAVNGTRISRDAGGAIRAIEVPASGWPSLALHYQANGHRRSWHSADTGTETIRVNKQGRPVQRRFANGDVWRYTYDSRGRPIRLQETGAGQTWITTLAWRGRLLTGITHPHEDETRDYDQRGRLAKRTVTRPANAGGKARRYRESFEYDAQNRLLRHHLPEGGALVYLRQRDGGLRGIDWIDSHGATHPVIARRKHGYRYGNGLDVVARYSKGRISDLTVLNDRRIILAESRDYDTHGQLLRERHAAPLQHYDKTWRYAYDDKARMIGAAAGAPDSATGKTIWYAWRQNGSLAARRDNTDVVRPSIHRDPSGLPRTIGDTTLHYGPSRRPLRVVRQGETLATYRYNAFGQRIAAIQAGRRTDYFYLDNRVVAQSRQTRTPPSDTSARATTGSPHITRRYIYAGHVPVGMIDYTYSQSATDPQHAREPGPDPGPDATLYAMHADMLGAPRAVTDAHQVIRWLATYSPTGDATRIAGDLTLDIRLPGQLFDSATGWHDNLLRTYSPQWGHYLEPDPLGPVPGNQAFGYARQQPRRYVDPLGLLLFAFDGTRNNAQTQSNVWKMSQLYQDGPVFYQAGPGNPADLDWDAITAYSAPDILDAQWESLLQVLSEPAPMANTIPIDIIGFSRGAALARHFANQINNYVVNGYFSYTDAQQGAISACVDLRFMGLFDTVAQFGLLGAQNANYDLGIASAWEWVAHAVALHERRWLFPLTSADKGGGNTIEAPFIGAHADIGGGVAIDDDGNTSSRGDLADVALNWMLWQARAASVRLAPGKPDDTGITLPILHDERSALVRSAQNGDRRVNAPDGTKIVNYQDDHVRLGRKQRDATEAFITRIDRWRRSQTVEVGTVDMAGYTQWLHDELGWQSLARMGPHHMNGEHRMAA